MAEAYLGAEDDFYKKMEQIQNIYSSVKKLSNDNKNSVPHANTDANATVPKSLVKKKSSLNSSLEALKTPSSYLKKENASKIDRNGPLEM